MRKIEINSFFDNFPVAPESQLAFLENYYQVYPASHFVTFLYLKLLQERFQKKFESVKSKLLLSIQDRQAFYDCKIDYFAPQKLLNNKSDEIAELSEQFQHIVPKIKFDPNKHNAEINMAELGEIEDVEFISETLAMVYADQGYHGKATQMLKKLILKYPEKNAYFAALIEKVKNSVNQNQNLEDNNH